MSNKERAELTYAALQERKRKKATEAKEKYKLGLSLTIESIQRHRGRSNLKYFF